MQLETLKYIYDLATERADFWKKQAEISDNKNELIASTVLYLLAIEIKHKTKESIQKKEDQSEKF